MIRAISIRAYLFVVCVVYVLSYTPGRAYQSDNGNGTYNNPVLYADYPDPTICRAGSDFYLVSTTFADSPGMNVLHSKDLVNWEIVSHCATNLDWSTSYNTMSGYLQGFWAGSIEYYNGTFYVLANPVGANARIYYATNAAGPWQYYQLNQGAYDASLFIETNGTGYIVEGHGPQNILTLNSTFSQVVAVSNNVVDSGGEGSHLVKKGSYYYLFNANPGIWPFQLRCARATNIFGPWETGHICLTATTGGHQGGIVDLDDTGTNWFGYVHQDSGAIGRMTRVGPVYFTNNWPVFGTPAAPNLMGTTYTKPVLGQTIMQPATSDDFTSSTLGLQWQWNHNPDNTRWSLTARSGYLRLMPTLATNFWAARNSLSQKGQGPLSSGWVKLDITNLKSNDMAGFGTFGKVNARIYVTADVNGNKTLGMDIDNRGVGAYTAATGVPYVGNTIYLRTDMDFNRSLGICSYSSDGSTWTVFGGQFPLDFDLSSTFQGQKYAISCFNAVTGTSTGYVDVDSFTLTNTASLVTGVRGRAKLNAARTTFVADDGQPLRGPYESTEWTTAASYAEVSGIKQLGFNAVHLYAESFDPTYPTNGSTAPGYNMTEVDKMVSYTRDLGLYLVITIGNGAYNGNHNLAWATNFWALYGARYATNTHVLYEIHNEPMAWGPSYLTGTTPAGTMDMEVACYNKIRSVAPNTPVLLFTYAVFGGTGGTSAALMDITNFNQRVFSNVNAVWTNEVVGFHGYAGWAGTAQAVAGLIAAGYPCMMTEFYGLDWGGGSGLDVEMTSELERLGVSWLTFLGIGDANVTQNVGVSKYFKDFVDRAGLSWTPDYGYWPVARGPYGNGGQPRSTTTNWVGNVLTGTLRIQAEDFDNGGQGVAYNDTWSVNQGGQYRTGEGVDIETTSDTGGGYDINNTAAGEWLEYTIWVQEPGYYNLSLRYASTAASSVQVTNNYLDKTGTWTLPATGGSQTWVTMTTNVFLEFGRQKLRLSVLSGTPSLNWIELSPSTSAPVANGTYKLVNRATGQAMTYDTTNFYVALNPYSGGTVQQWTLQHLGAGEYKVSSAYNNDNWSCGGLENDKVSLVWWWGTDAKGQRAVLRPIGNGYYRISLAGTGLELEPQGGNTTNGTPVVPTSNQNGYTGLAQQQWGIVSATAPGIPTGLVAAWGSSAQVNLTWSPVSGATSYNVKRATVSGGPYTTIATGVMSASYSDATAVAGTTYYYVVSAVVSSVESLNSAEATPPQLRAYLKFDETSGTNAVDFTGSGWTGALYGGGTWVSGKFGNAVDLSGSSQYVKFPNGVVNGLTNFSIATWVFLDANTTWSRLFDFGNGTSSYMFLTVNNGSVVRFALNPGTGEQVVSGAAPLPTGAWTHVAVTLSGSTASLYVNGVLVGQNTSMTATPSSLGATTQNYIGRSQYSDPYLNGRVDEFRIYSMALSASDVAALYAYQVTTGPVPPTPSGLVATAASSSQINLVWNSVTNLTGYNVKRSTINGGPYSVIAGGLTSTNFSDTGLTPGATYYYVVSAVNANGEGTNSTQASATTLTSPVAVVYNVNFAGSTTTPYAATNGTILVAPTTGGSERWNNYSVSAPWVNPSPVTLVAANEATTNTVTLNWGGGSIWTDGPTGWSGYNFSALTNTIWPAYMGDSGNATVWFSGLATNATYDVYVYFTWDRGSSSFTYNLMQGTAAVTNLTLNTSPAFVYNTQGTSYVNGTNYVVFSTVTPTASGVIMITNGNYSALQLVKRAAVSAPAAPAGLIATTASSSQINLSWSGVTNATTYNVKRATVNGGPYTSIATGVAVTNYSDTGLTAGTTYYYVVSAVNANGESANSAQASATTSGGTLAAPPIRVMPLGDSITMGIPIPGGYRNRLYQLMTNAGYNLDFVGLQTGNPTNTLPDSNSEGHPGWLIANNQYSTSGYQQGLDSIINGSLEQVEDPDVVLLLIGVNDFGAGYDTANAINRLNALVTKIATNRPASKIIVASLLPVANAAEELAISNSYNAYIPTLVSNQVAAGRQVYYTDLHSAITTNDLADGLHPNQLGYDKMATNWFGALTNQLTTYGTPNAPAIARVVGVGGLTNIVVVFNKPVRASAATAANYSVSGGVSVLGATLDPVGMRKVTLTTTAQQPGSNYTLTVIGGVQDQTAAATAIAANSTATFQSSATRGATNNVPEGSGYQLVYSLNISNSANYLAGVSYNTDQRASVSNFTRVAYYVELQRSNAPLQYLWASMKTFTTNVNLIGVPTTANATTIQGLVTNLNVLSNARDIVNGTNLAGGTIQFWPWTYAASNSLDLLNASDSFFDWGNQPDPSSTYGSMSLGNSTAAQMLFSFNNLTGSGNSSLGIGNNPGPGFWQVDYDWTGMNNAADYTVKTLQVFVKPTNPNAPTLVSATAQPGRTNLVLTFSRSLQTGATNLANYSLSGGKTILQAQLDGTKQIVTLTTAQLLSGATYTITANNVYDLTTSTVIDPDNNSITFQAPQEADLSVAVYNVNFAGNSSVPYPVTNGTTLLAPTTGGSEQWNNIVASAAWVNPSPVTLVAANEANPNPVTLTWGGGSIWTDGPTGWSGYNFTALTNTIWPTYMGDSGNAAVWFSGLATNATYDVYVYFTWDRGASSFTYNLMQGSAAVTNLTLNTSPAFVYNTQGKSLVSGTNYVVFSTVTPTASGVIMITNGNYSALQLVKRTAAPGAPTGLAATTVSTSQINLSWNSVTNAFGYHVKRATVNGGPYTVIATNLTSTNYSNTGLSAATTYYYVVSASNAVGESANSAQANATTLTGQTAPTLAAIANRVTGVGVTMLITNVATDSDVPTQTLTYSLLTAPANAVINTNSGVLTWRPLVIHANSTNGFTVRVTDSGTPNLSATQSFTVTVTNLAAPTVTNVTLNQGMLVMQVNGANGPDYEVQTSTNLVNWSPVFTTNSPAMPFVWSTGTTNGPLGFFRIVVGPPVP